MPATILPFDRVSSAPTLPIDELSELNAELTMLCFALERCSDPNYVAPSSAQLGALARHAIDIQRQFQEVARQVLTFAGQPPDDESEFSLGNPAIERLQRAALFGVPLDDDDDE